MSASRPRFSLQEAATFIRELYGMQGQLTTLPSERDQNFLLTTPAGERFTFKITGLHESREILEMQNQAMRHLNRLQPGLCPLAVSSISGRSVESVTSGQGPDFLVRLVSYLPGKLYADADNEQPELQRSLGRCLGGLDRHLASFSHPAAGRTLKWDLLQAAGITDYAQHISVVEDRLLVEYFLADFLATSLPCLVQLDRQVIHNDANDYNVLVGQDGDGRPLVSGIIDFGDMVAAPVICELAIGAAYASLHQPDPLGAVRQVIIGYQALNPRPAAELALLYNLIAMRLCVSVTYAAYNQSLEPDNSYLQISAQPAWQVLRRWLEANPSVLFS